MSIQTKTMVVKSDTALAETKTTIRDTVTFDVSKMPNGITYKGLKAVLSFAEPIQWNKTSTYDALTVVWDDATHASYASKRRVPQNIELTNEFYWLRTADLDAQVEMYRAEVQEYRQEVQAFDGRITANVQAIAAETARAEGAEQTLQENIDNVAKKPIMVVTGDSWNVNLGSGVWSDSVTDRKVINVAVAGSGLLNAGPDGKSTFEQQLIKANDQIADKTKVDLVYGIGFINDIASNVVPAAQLTTAISSFVNKAKEFFPNAKIILVSNSYNTGATIQTFDAIKHICITANLNGACFKDITGMLPTEYLDSTQHPNLTGSKVLYNLIYSDSYQSVLNQTSIFPTAFNAEKAHLATIESNDFIIDARGTRLLNNATVAFTPKATIPAGTNKFKELVIDNKWLLLSLREGGSFAPLFIESKDSTPIGLIRKSDEVNKLDLIFFKEAPANVKVIADITSLM